MLALTTPKTGPEDSAETSVFLHYTTCLQIPQECLRKFASRWSHLALLTDGHHWKLCVSDTCENCVSETIVKIVSQTPLKIMCLRHHWKCCLRHLWKLCLRHHWKLCLRHLWKLCVSDTIENCVSQTLVKTTTMEKYFILLLSFVVSELQYTFKITQ